MVKLLADLRAAIVEGHEGANLDTVRGLLHQLFEEVVYRPRDAGDPIMRVEGYEESVVP